MKRGFAVFVFALCLLAASAMPYEGHGNESCNLIGSKGGQDSPISAHGPRKLL
ncbi:hypothetical protein ACROYT_G041774 [Oculina patagonica]